MREYYGRLSPFWENDLATYVAEHSTPIAPHAVPHINYEGTMLKQTFNEDLPNCWQQFYKALCVEEGSVCWLTMEPRDVIPVHKDYFYMLKTKKNVEVDACVRYLIMLEDWAPGHVVQLGDLVLTDWKRGDVWRFDHTIAHWAANCGSKNFYSCQVSTLK